MQHDIFATDLNHADTNILLRSVYNWMMIGLLVSGLSAFMVAHSPLMIHMLFGNPYMIWVLLLIELGLVFAISAGINKMDVSTARVLFILFSVIDGMTLGSIFLVFTETSIAMAFFIAALTFGVMSLYGYFTDTDLGSVRDALIEAGYEIEDLELAMIPKMEVELPVDQAMKVMNLLERLEDLDDVQKVYSNLTMSDELLAQLEAA